MWELSIATILLRIQMWTVILCRWVSGSKCFEDLLDIEDEGIVILWNVRNNSSSDVASYPRRLEPSNGLNCLIWKIIVQCSTSIAVVLHYFCCGCRKWYVCIHVHACACAQTQTHTHSSVEKSQWKFCLMTNFISYFSRFSYFNSIDYIIVDTACCSLLWYNISFI